MDLKETLDNLASRLENQIGLLNTEEATKNALVMPVINSLGYNVFDPTEVTPEFTADIGTKKGEKVDYAIKINDFPMMLVECKSVNTKLGFDHASQLYRYFGVTDARFAVLTNGLKYWFYTDLDSPNKMDKVPFFEFDLQDYDKKDVEELSKFSKSAFDLDNILSNASELKYVKKMAKIIEGEFNEPSEEFVKYLTNRVYSGRLTSSICEQFTPLVRTAFRQFVNGSLSARLRTAFSGVDTDSITATPANEQTDDDGIITTNEEIEGFHIVRALLAKQIDPSRVVMRDTKSYCGVLLDDNNRKPICRLHFNTAQKYIGLFDIDKNESRIPISIPKDIYQYADKLAAKIDEYDNTAGSVAASS